MKKCISLFLSLVMIFALAACSAEQSDSSDSGTSEPSSERGGNETTPPTIKELTGFDSSLDYDGYVFKTLIRSGQDDKWLKDMYIETSSPDVVDDAIYKRNLAVSDEFNVEFNFIVSSQWNYETDALDSILAGSDDYDLIVPHARAAFVYANSKTLLDWNSISAINLDQSWWDQDARANFSMNYKLYVMDGDISYQCTGATCAMLFNKALITDLNTEYPYELVNDGSWTFEKFTEYAKMGKSDINGDGTYTIENDRFGYITSSYGGPIQVLYAAGQKILSKDTDDIPYITLNTPQTVDTIDWFFGLEDDNTAYFFREMAAEVAVTKLQPRDVFKENRAMFMDVNICDISILRDSETDFGIVPWPKYDESSSRYYSNVDAGTNLFCIPVTATDPERTGAVLEALCAEGQRKVLPSYYEIALKTKYSRDDESEAMLDLIVKSRIFDLGYFNYWAIGDIGNGLIAFLDSNNKFSSWYAKYETVANKMLEKTLENYQ